MPEKEVNGLVFRFPDDWIVEKFDDWAFYRNRFVNIAPGLKAVDLIAFSPNETLWLIEAKDYRVHPRTKPSELHDEMAIKALYTLAALLPAKLCANNQNEITCAAKALKATSIKIILHIEQAGTPSKLRPQVVDPALVLQRLRQRVHDIDPHPRVVSKNALHGLPWTVV